MNLHKRSVLVMHEWDQHDSQTLWLSTAGRQPVWRTLTVGTGTFQADVLPGHV